MYYLEQRVPGFRLILLALRNLSNEAVKMITERGTSERFEHFRRNETNFSTRKYSDGLFCFVFLATEKNEGLLRL